MHVGVGNLAFISESILEYEGKRRHDCTLIHWCSDGNKVIESIIHNEIPQVQLTWRTIEQLKQNQYIQKGFWNLSPLEVVKLDIF